MGMRVAFQLDAPESLDLARDSSFALAVEGFRRGYDLHWYGVESLALDLWRLRAFVYPLRVGDLLMEYGGGVDCFLDEMDVILMRQNPPFDMGYLHGTWLLEYLPSTTLVMNDPRAVRDAPEKLLRGSLVEYSPPTLISSDLSRIRDFARRQTHGVVLKPLYGYGGYGVVRVLADEIAGETASEVAREGEGDSGILARHLRHWGESWDGPPVVQAYLPEVLHSDRRVFMIGGEAVGVIGRIPAAGEFRSNLGVGGVAIGGELRAHEREVARLVGETLGADKILFAGLDFIGDYLTEVNLTCPTGLPSLEETSGINGAALFWDALETLRLQRGFTNTQSIQSAQGTQGT